MTGTETEVSGKNYRVWDEANSSWKRVSFWTKASDVENDDGQTLEDTIGDVDGITSSLASTSTTYALSASAGKTLKDTCDTINESLGTISSKIGGNFAFNNMESQLCSISSTTSSAVNFGGNIIGTSNTGNFIIITASQFSSNAGMGGIWFAHFEAIAANNYVNCIMGDGTSSNAPQLYSAASGAGLRVKNGNASSTVNTRLIVLKY